LGAGSGDEDEQEKELIGSIGKDTVFHQKGFQEKWSPKV
jgi:hypothetical protein